MQYSDRALARRYARALFETASAGGEVEKVHQELGEVLKRIAPLCGLFKRPGVDAAGKKALLENLEGPPLSAGMSRFLGLLIDKKRFYLLALVAAEFGGLADEFQGIARARVQSAVELKAQEIETLRRKLESFAGRKVVLEIKTCPELVGGVVVRIGDWVLDGSLRGKLKRLAAQLAAA